MFYSPSKKGKTSRLVGQWKDYGLKLTAQILSFHEKKALIDFDLSLSQPKKSSNSQVLSHKITSRLAIALNKNSSRINRYKQASISYKITTNN